MHFDLIFQSYDILIKMDNRLSILGQFRFDFGHNFVLFLISFYLLNHFLYLFQFFYF